MLISVIIPAYNAERFIRETLRSVLDQTHTDLEVIVVDDGSTDNTVSIIKELKAADTRIVIHQQANQGSSVARNCGIGIAKSDYIAFLDADDLWHPTKLEKQIAVLSNAPADVGLVYTWCRMIDNQGIISGFSGVYAEKRGHVVNELIVDNFIANGSVAMVRRNCLPKPEPFDPEQLGNEDFYFYLRIAAEYKVEVVPEFLVGYRWNTGANKSWNIKRQYASYYQMLGKIRVHYPQVSKRAIDKSIACFNLGMARLFFKREKYKEAFLLFISTVIRNPSCLTAPPFYRLIGLVVRWTLRKVASAQCPQVAFLQSNTKAFKLLTVSEA